MPSKKPAVATVHSDRLGVDLRLGRTPAQKPSSEHVRMSDLLKAVGTALPAIPANWGHGYAFGEAGWGMLANGPCDDGTIPQSWYAYDGVGCCDWSCPAHETMEAAKGAGRPVPRFTCLSVANEYGLYLGLPGAEAINAGNDQGTDMQANLSRRQTRGMLDAEGNAWKIGKTITLDDWADLNQIWAAAYLFESAEIGVNLQQAQMDQFDASQTPTWDYVAGSPIIGGHAIPIVGKGGLVSWGERVGWTAKFAEHCIEEAYSFIDTERYNAVTGKTAEGFDDADLEAYAAAVIKLKTNA